LSAHKVESLPGEDNTIRNALRNEIDAREGVYIDADMTIPIYRTTNERNPIMIATLLSSLPFTTTAATKKKNPCARR